MGGPDPDGDYDNLQLTGTPYVQRRSPKDRAWVWALGALYAGCLITSIYAWKHSNAEFLKLNPDYLNDPDHCPARSADGRALLAAPDAPPAFDLASFWAQASVWVAVSSAASLALAAGFLHLVRHHAHALARGTIAFQLAIPAAAALGLGLAGQPLPALGLGALAGVTCLVFYLWRREVGSATRLLSVAGHGLGANPALVGLAVALNLASLALALPQLAAVAVAVTNGDVVPNPARGGRDACADAYGDGVPCCAWQLRGWVPGFLAAAALAAAWTMLTAQQVRVFVVSGAVAQWYFSPPGAPTAGAAARSLRHALGPQLGTNVLGGLVLTITSAIRQQNSADQQGGGGSFLGFLASCLAQITEYLTKFAVVMASISGLALVPAGRKVTDLLARNLLDAFATTVWFPSAVVALVSATMSALWGAAVWGAYQWTHAPGPAAHPANDGAVLGLLAGGVALFVLSFLSGVLLSVLDAVFVCFALDRDRATVGNAALYEALLGVAEERGLGVGAGAAVEQPSGEMAYAPPAVQLA